VDIRLMAARYRLGELRGEELPNIAVALLEGGHDSQPLRELAGLDRPTLRDAGELFEKVLAALGQEIPDERGARLLLLERVLELLVSGGVDPVNGAYDVWYTASELFGEQREEWIPFEGLASVYEDYPAGRAEIGREIVDHATRALARLRAATA
jgi:hypothetical protein